MTGLWLVKNFLWVGSKFPGALLLLVLIIVSGGHEGTGLVAALGSQVRDLNIGDEVGI